MVAAAALAAAGSVALRAQQRPGEGITVHGHWLIEVHNPDGSLASRHEFENSLSAGAAFAADGGSNALAGVLGRAAGAPSYEVVLAESNPFAGDLQTAVVVHDNRGPCGPSGHGVCSVNEGPDLALKLYYINVQSPNPFGGREEHPYPSFDLVGKVTATGNGPIGWVNTLMHLGPWTFNFTGHGLSTPIQVVRDQIIQFTVTISFS